MGILQTNEIFKTELSEGQHRMSDDEIKHVQKVVYDIAVDVTNLCDELSVPYMLTGGTALGAVRHGDFIPWDDDIDMVVSRADIDRLLDAIEERYSDRYYVEAPLRTAEYLSSFIQVHKKGTVCQEYLSIPEERCGIKIDIFVVENTYDHALRRIWHGICVECGLFMISCYRMFLWKKEFMDLARGNKKATYAIRLKSAIGALFAPKGTYWYERVQRCMQKCKNNHSKYIVVPSGRKHFFGELREREQFMAAAPLQFGNHTFKFPKNIDWYLTYMYGDYKTVPKEQKREYHVVYKVRF